jgi:DNA-binding MurR/RpiR family transcriptional regulator
MHTIVAIGEIKERAEAIGSTLSQIAADAGLSPSTALRLAKGKTQHGWITTNMKLVKALVAREAKVRAHLAQVPSPSPEEGEAA